MKSIITLLNPEFISEGNHHMVDSLRQELLTNRPDLAIIVDMIPDNARVLDLGCGDGTLLRLLKEAKNVKGSGVENTQDNILGCVKNGVPVIQQDLNDGLADFPEQAYDYVILSQTLQAVDRPDQLLSEMVKIGQNVVISFINFGHISNRLQLLWSGQMPVTSNLPNPWYHTSNIHLATIRDFRMLCREKNLRTVKEIPLTDNGPLPSWLPPNLFATTCVFVLST